jgi:3-keto-5-aminohexanoate cleavage enzyme
MSRTLITVAPTGAEVDKARFPQLPTSLEELLVEAKACQAAGAAMIHVHIRDGEHRACATPFRPCTRKPI